MSSLRRALPWLDAELGNSFCGEGAATETEQFTELRDALEPVMRQGDDRTADQRPHPSIQKDGASGDADERAQRRRAPVALPQ